jgi:hypothetical protein
MLIFKKNFINNNEKSEICWKKCFIYQINSLDIMNIMSPYTVTNIETHNQNCFTIHL